MKKSDIRLYNVLFPFWFLYLLPSQLWLLLLPANFLVDSLVIWFSAQEQGLEDFRKLWKQSILPVWIIGFLSDFIGAVITFVLYLILNGVPGMIHLGTFPGSTLISIPGVIVAGVLIYVLNKVFSFYKAGLDRKQLHTICLHLALWTAPYTMLIPAYL